LSAQPGFTWTSLQRTSNSRDGVPDAGAIGQPVTVFQGEGMRSPVDELYVACRRRDLKRILEIVNEESLNLGFTYFLGGRSIRIEAISLCLSCHIFSVSDT
jgi:hypothetical protein